MANVRDSDTSLWLHNKLGTSNDSWISGSICSQLNKEVLRNIKECFPDLQTQVKLKLLLSFFHIPRRLVEEWKTELDGVIEVAGLDTELWVSMLAESMKTFPATSSLNTEISDYEDTRPIFTEMVNDLRKLVAKHSDLGMLPLECQYLNKNALVSVVGQQPNPVKHFTIKRKPKSATLRTELLHKSADAQSSLKKASAPTIPLRSRGMPRKMTDTTPLKGIPSRMPTSGFRSPNVNPNNQQRPNLSRTPAGRKDGGIKLIEFTEQPLGYAAAKKRKREQQLEEQARKHEQKAAAAAAADNSSPTSNSAPSNNAATTSVPSTTTTNSFEIKTEPTSLLNRSQSNNIDDGGTLEHKEDIKPEIVDTIASSTHSESISTPEYAPPPLSYTQTTPGGLIDNVGTHSSLEVTKPITSNDVTASSLQQQTQQQKSGNNNNNSNTKRANNAPAVNQQPSQQAQTQPTQIIQQTHTQQHQSSNPNTTTQYILTQQQPTQQQQQHQQTLSTLTAYTQNRQQNTYTATSQTPQTPTSTKILLKTSPSSGVVIRQQQQQQQQQQQSQQTVGNPPPLIATATSTSSAPTLLNIQNVQLPNRPVTIQPASQAAQQQHLQAQLQQQQHTLVSNNTATQQPKLTQVLMQPSGSTGTATVTTTPANANLKNKTIILTQKGVILRNIVGDMYEQIPISNVSGLQTLGSGSTTLMTTAAGPPGLVKTTTVSALPQTQTITLQQQPQSQVTKTQLPTLIPTQQHMIVQQQPQATASLITNPTQQTIIRPVMANVQSGLTTLPGGLTLIQRPGQQPQLVQVQTTPVQQAQQQTQIQRTIITQPAIQQTTQQLRPQQIVLQQKPAATQRLITSTQQIQLQQNAAGGIQRIIQLPQQQQQTQQATQTQQQQQQQQQTQPQQQTAPQRKGLQLTNEHVHEAHEMFRKANRVSRPDKALILGFMAGLRENPRPNSENVIVIKLGEKEEIVQQEDGNTALCLVESHIRLDYNTGEWKTFQNYRRLDQSTQSSTENASSSNNVMQSQNSVVI
uniref:HDAg domain-containing protein n=1 Tax=Glossina austeni TaxID=7395 RepID=A0A1A9UJS2_GLOAU